jgi:ATP-dependent DNA ligase
MPLPVTPPVSPMLAKSLRELPEAEGMVYEPKWDGFRCIVFRDGDDVELGSRNTKPLDRYFPELREALRANLPDRCVLDGEIVVAGDRGLDFDALQQRIHPAESRVRKLAAETPASFVAFDALADGDEDLRPLPFRARRARLERLLAGARPPIHLTPATTDVAVAAEWFDRFEGAGLDGVMAKPADLAYVEGKRLMFKIKHERTADCVVAGFRAHKSGDGVGSLLLGLYDGDGTLHHVGVATSFSAARRAELTAELAPYREGALEGHPWRDWAEAAAHEGGRMPGGPSRWSGGKDLSWQPLRIELVAEVSYDHLQGDRFRHATRLVRWRPDRDPAGCTYDQLDQPVAEELARVFGS